MPASLIVVLGLGDAGVVHARALAKHRNIRLGLACSRPAALQEVATALCADATYTSYEAALADPCVRAVVIATAPAQHVALVEAAAAAGKHVLCEKPLCYDVSTARRVVHAVDEAGIRFMTALMRRWDTSYRRARAHARTGALGRVTAVHTQLGDPFHPQKFLETPDDAHLFHDVCVHDADAAPWLAGQRVTRVFASGLGPADGAADRSSSGLDAVSGVLELSGGARALVHVDLVRGFGNHASAEVIGTKGTVRLGGTGGGIEGVELVTEGESLRGVPRSYRERFAAAFDAQMVAFVRLVLASDEEAKKLVASEDSYADARSGFNATCVADAMRRSHESGQAVVVEYE